MQLNSRHGEKYVNKALYIFVGVVIYYQYGTRENKKFLTSLTNFHFVSTIV